MQSISLYGKYEPWESYSNSCLNNPTENLKLTPPFSQGPSLDIDPTDPYQLIRSASFTLDTDAGPVDFLNDVSGAADYNAMRSRTRQADVGGVTVWVVGYEYLIRMKEASGREQDLRNIDKLRNRHSAPE